MKKQISLLLALCICLSLFAACGSGTPTATSAEPASAATTHPADGTTAAPTTPQSSMDALDGKRILFVGNSYTQNAHTVMDKGYVLTQDERDDDRGLFYHLCKQKGIEVSVTNWCFGGHNLVETFADVCPKSTPCGGTSHPAHLVDREFDYVCLQGYMEPEFEGDLNAYLQPIMDLFREANPNVKFVILVPHMAVERDCLWTTALNELTDPNILVCNWGAMLHDIVSKKVSVPGAQQSYYRPTFVISVNADDGHHQNILAGYLTALMVYCAITGESAEGQPYEFCDNTRLNLSFDLEAHQTASYTFEPYTNFVDVFRSKADMLGLQQLTDQYIAHFNGGN